MFDIKLLRENPELVKEGLAKKGVEVDVDRVLELDKERRVLLKEIEELRHLQKEANRKIAKAQGEEKERLVAEMRGVAGKIKELSPKLDELEEELNKLLHLVPNLPLEEVPVGRDESENVVVKVVEGELPPLDFPPRDYMQIARKLDIIDTERAAKVSGTRFGYLKREAVLLEFALVQFALETLMAEGFIPVVPPVMIRREAMAGMGYLAWGEDEIYYLPKDELYLVGTSEQSIGPMHMGEILSSQQLPLRYVGFSTCFRREAGSYGRDTKGILRVHQFDKVEMFSFCEPEKSRQEHQFIISMQEKLVRALKIPYRVVQMCTGDLGTPAANKVDIECWMPGQGEYRETHSASNCTDYQARALNIRYKQTPDSPPRFVHTLNGTAYAIGRMIIAIIENYQQPDGSVVVPEVLRKYMGGLERIGPR